MPLYDYKCEECSHVFEAITHLFDEKVSCPECDSMAKRVGTGQIRSYKIKGNNSASVTPKKFRN